MLYCVASSKKKNATQHNNNEALQYYNKPEKPRPVGVLPCCNVLCCMLCCNYAMLHEHVFDSSNVRSILYATCTTKIYCRLCKLHKVENDHLSDCTKFWFLVCATCQLAKIYLSCYNIYVGDRKHTPQDNQLSQLQGGQKHDVYS